jgi:hypothetical protein
MPPMRIGEAAPVEEPWVNVQTRALRFTDVMASTFWQRWQSGFSSWWYLGATKPLRE